MPTIEGVRLKILEVVRKGLSKYRYARLSQHDFTIISNNCWGGMIYESYNLRKQSPTVGLFFMASDYIKFVSDLKSYIKYELIFICPEESKWKNEFLSDSDFGKYPIGKLNDIEIFFVHYKNEKEAKEKWERRCKRINWNHMLVKFNDQNGCTAEDVRKFDCLDYNNKICFCVKEYADCKSVIRIKAPKKHLFIRTSYEPFGKNKYIDLDEYLNSL